MTSEQQHHFRNSVCCIFAITRLMLDSEYRHSLPAPVIDYIEKIHGEAIRAGIACGMNVQSDCYLQLVEEFCHGR